MIITPTFFEYKKRKIAYCIYGEQSLSHVVFYFHGFPGSRLEVSFFHREAMRCGLSIIAIDRPGMGQSEHDPDRSVLSIPEIIAALADSLHIEKYFILGVSGGTPYALATVAEHADRVTGCIIVSGVGPFHEVNILNKMSPFDRFALRLVKERPLFAKPLVSVFWTLWRFLPEKMFHYFVGTLSSEDKDVLLSSAGKRFFLGGMKEVFSGDRRGIYRDLELLVTPWGVDFTKIKCPVTFIHGDDDRFVPPFMSVSNAVKIPGSNVELLPKAGHFVFFLLAKKICERIR